MFMNIMLIFLERFSHHYVMESRMHAYYELMYRNARSVVGLEWELRMRTVNQLTARTHCGGLHVYNQSRLGPPTLLST